MVESLKNYIASKDWRIIVIEVVSLILAILSAALLESKFFQIYIHSEFWATVFAGVVVFAFTFVAYVVADNLQAKSKEGSGRKAMVAFLSLCYGAVLIILLGMSNYTMSVLKIEKDVVKIESKLIGLDDLPKIIAAKKTLVDAELIYKSEMLRLQKEIDKLSAREDNTGSTYVTKKQEYEKHKEQEKTRYDKAKAIFKSVRDAEERRMSSQATMIAQADKSSDGLGKLLAENPAALPILALVILFTGRLSFSSGLSPSHVFNANGVTLTTTKTTHSASITVWSQDRDGWIKAIAALAHERSLGNGTGMLSEIAQYFDVNKGTVCRAVKLAQDGKPINVPKKFLPVHG